MAIIKNLGVGIRDTHQACLWFEVYISENGTSLQILFGKVMLDFIKAADCYNILAMEGKPCWVDVDRGSMKFLRLWKNKE